MNMKKILLWGFLLWLCVFLISFVLFPIRQNNYPFFETLMTLVLVYITVIFTKLFYAKNETSAPLVVGIMWVGINLLIDLPLFLLGGPMKMTPMQYVQDIGLTYLVIPVIVGLKGKRVK